MINNRPFWDGKQQQPQGQQIRININELQVVSCECGSPIFENIFMARIVPATVSPSGKQELMFQSSMRCYECKKPLTIEDAFACEQDSKIISA